MNILYVSRYAVYDGVPHAGGNTVLYYMKSMAMNSRNDVRMVSFITEEEFGKVNLREYNITYYPIPWKKSVLGMVKSINSKINPFHHYCNMTASYHIEELIEKIKDISNNYLPDIVVVEWTQLVLAVDKIKQVFPNAKYIASEHDVTFLAVERKFLRENNLIKKMYKYLIYLNTKRRELATLNLFDKIITHNEKDKQILIENGIPSKSIMPIVAYYHQTAEFYHRTDNHIVYYGALSRKENIDSVIWFLENVLPKLNDIDVQFYVVGGGLTKELKTYESDRVIFTGYVDSIDNIFSSAMCFVAPLVLGAGIKVKVLEAMYTGITVITNDIGIEGIPAVKNRDYYHCENAAEYANTIRKIYHSEIPMLNANAFVTDSFDIRVSLKKYVELMDTLYIE